MTKKSKSPSESYKHESAKQVLKKWFEPEYTVEIEKEFFIDGKLSFIPDITLMQETTIRAIYEIVHKHGLNGKKLGLIQYWCFLNYDFPVYEINADYILNQVNKPDVIEADKFETKTHDFYD
jgi:hydroxyacyl-ACP dehydratase HTD2-like protein with hotdog domain